MSALAALQSRFLGGLLDGSDGAAGDIHDARHFSVEQRLAVYANAYRRRLVEALASVYERAFLALGDEAFDALALAYVESHAPTDRSLARYGADFPEWMRRRDPALGIVADVATIDAALRRAFEASDATPILRDALLGLAPMQWASLRLRFVPALSVGAVHPNAIARWRSVAGPGPHEPDAPTDGVMPRVPVAFWRKDEQTLFRSLADDEASLLARLRDDATLAQACFADDQSPIAIERAAALLLAWVDEGWVAALAHD